MRFRKQPVEVSAVRWWRNGDHPDDGPRDREGLVVRYFRSPIACGEWPCGQCDRLLREHGWIETLEGGLTVCPGDWVVTGVKGERYPVKDAIFQITYEPVGDL